MSGHASQIAEALERKVSRERVGTELAGMLTGPDPITALHLLHRLGLMRAVFQADLPEQACLDSAGLVWEAARVAGLELSESMQRDLLMAALLLPVRDRTVPNPKGQASGLGPHAVRAALKWPSKSADAVGGLHAAAPVLLRVLDELQAGRGSGETDPGSEPAAGTERDGGLQLALGRALLPLKQGWQEGCMLAAALPFVRSKQDGSNQEEREQKKSGTLGHVGEETTAAAVEGYRCLTAAARGWGLEGCWEWRSPLNGKEVMALLGVAGKQVGVVMSAITDWQLTRPGGSAEECRAWLLADPRWKRDEA